jgi:hypothetical protein
MANDVQSPGWTHRGIRRFIRGGKQPKHDQEFAIQRICRVGGGLPSLGTGFVFSVCRLISRRCHIIPSILSCPSAPLRTVLALLTHTAPHSVFHMLSQQASACYAMWFRGHCIRCV